MVGVLETRKPPTPAVVAKIAAACRRRPGGRDAAGRADGQPGGRRPGRGAVGRDGPAQARRARSSTSPGSSRPTGSAPLPPVAQDDLAAIGRTNDAILYGARVVLYVTGDDASLEEIGPKVPSSSSRDYGEPFAAIFARYNNDFYAVDPHLFSPAEVVFQNLETGRVHAFGEVDARRPGPVVLVVKSNSSELDRTGRLAMTTSSPWSPASAGTSQDLRRAAGGLDIALRGRPVPEVVGVAWATGRPRVAAGGIELDASRRRARPDDAAGEPGAGGLPDGRPARLAASGVPVLNPPRAVEAAVDKYLTLALLDAGRAARPADLGRAVGRPRRSRPSRRWAATWWSSRCSARRGAGSCGSATASIGLADASTRSSGWGPSSTSSG